MSGSALAPGLARKVKKILEIKTESSDLISALNTLSEFYGDNNPAARRQLRSTIEQRGLDINKQFLTAAEGVIEALDDLQAQLDTLSGSCTTISWALAASKAASAGLLTEADRLGWELMQLQGRQAAVTDFLEQYQLTPEEVSILQSGQVGPTFFAALERVRRIHDNCRQLLRSHHQRAGLELMDQMSGHQENAYEHLCRWVQAECRNLGEYDAPEVDPILTTAVAALRQRPMLFKYCAEEVASARHGALFQRFIVALTRGGPGGLPRPIEMHAHDPRRYVADMLAWVHQALASEREFVMALFGEHTDSHEGLAKPTSAIAAAADGLMTNGSDNHHHHHQQQQQQQQLLEAEGLGAAALLARIFESISRPLKVRVEQVLLMNPPLLLCYQLSQLVAFYYALIAKVLGEEASFTQTVGSCRDMATRTFLEQLKSAGDRLLRTPPTPTPDLRPPPQVPATLQTLTEVMNAYESSLHSDASGAAAGGDGSASGARGFAAVLDAVLDPLLEMCRRSAEALKADSPDRLDEGTRLDPTAHPVYLINCIAACQIATSLRPFCAPRTAALGSHIEEQLQVLVKGEVQRQLARCGLAEIVDRIRLYQLSSPDGSLSLASDPSLSLHAITEALRSFFVAMSSPDALPEFQAIQQPRLRSEAVSRVASSLVEAYEMVYKVLEDPNSGYLPHGGAAGVKHTPTQVRTILGVL